MFCECNGDNHTIPGMTMERYKAVRTHIIEKYGADRESFIAIQKIGCDDGERVVLEILADCQIAQYSDEE